MANCGLVVCHFAFCEVVDYYRTALSHPKGRPVTSFKPTYRSADPVLHKISVLADAEYVRQAVQGRVPENIWRHRLKREALVRRPLVDGTPEAEAMASPTMETAHFRFRTPMGGWEIRGHGGTHRSPFSGFHRTMKWNFMTGAMMANFAPFAADEHSILPETMPNPPCAIYELKRVTFTQCGHARHYVGTYEIESIS